MVYCEESGGDCMSWVVYYVAVLLGEVGSVNGGV